MVAFGSLLLLTACSALPFAAAQTDADDVYLTLQAIDNIYDKVLAPVVTSWNGSLLGILDFDDEAQNAAQIFIGATNTNTDTASNSVSAEDSALITAYLSGTFEPDVETLLNYLLAPIVTYELPAVPPIAITTIQGLATDTENYVASIIPLLTTDQTASGQAAADKIQADFGAAIAAVSS